MFKTIYNFELKAIVQRKGFIISTAIFAAIVFLLTFIPRIKNNAALNNLTSNMANKIADKTTDKETEKENIFAIYIKDNSIDTDNFLNTAMLKGSLTAASEQEIIDIVNTDKAKKGLIINDINNITVYVKKLAMYEKLRPEINEIIETYKKDLLIQKYNIDAKEFNQVLDNSKLNIDIKPLKQNEMALYPIAYASLFIMYIMILTYAQFTTMSVAREKNDRTMELLITSANPSDLILGKVLASCTGATIKMLVTIIAACIGISLNQAYFPTGILKVITQGFTPLSLTVFLSFFILGFIMYNMIFAAAGALVDRMEDVNSVIQPIVLLFVVLFLVSMFSINIPNSKLTEILAIIPFSSPLVMFSSYVMRGTPLLIVALSFLLLLITTILLCILAGRIYRLGSLSYGNKTSLIKAIRLIFSRS